MLALLHPLTEGSKALRVAALQLDQGRIQLVHCSGPVPLCATPEMVSIPHPP